MRTIGWLSLLGLVVLASGCGSVEYKDTNAAVDARPECAGRDPRPGEPVESWCKREQSANWSNQDTSKPIDFGGKDH
ncbi:MAG: hypothetical protein ACJ8GK_04050 [Luteimonas sp.]